MQINLQDLGGDDEHIKILVFRNNDLMLIINYNNNKKKSNKTLIRQTFTKFSTLLNIGGRKYLLFTCIRLLVNWLI